MNLSFNSLAFDRHFTFMLYMTLVSAGIGLVLGILIGIILRCVCDNSEDY